MGLTLKHAIKCAPALAMYRRAGFSVCVCVNCLTQQGKSLNDHLHHSNSLLGLTIADTRTHLQTIDQESVCENPSGCCCLSKTSVRIIPVIYPRSWRVMGGKCCCLLRSFLSQPESLPSNQALAWWLDQCASGCYSYRKLPFPVIPHFLLCARCLF